MRRLMPAEASVADAGGISHIIYIRKANSECGLQAAREEDGLKDQRTARITAIAARMRRRVLLPRTTRVRQREEALGPSRGMFYSRGETSIISPPWVTDSMGLFISLVQRETHQEAPCASSSREDSVLHCSRRRFDFTFKCARGQREHIRLIKKN